MPKATSKTVRPSTSTSHDLLMGLKSLSGVQRFTAFMRYSDLALQGLRTLHEHLRLCGPSEKEVNRRGMYDGRDAVLVDWDKVAYRNANRAESEQPPPYEGVAGELAVEPSAHSAVPRPPFPAHPPAAPQPDHPSIEEGDMLNGPPTPSEILDDINSDEEKYALQATREDSVEASLEHTPPNLFSELTSWFCGAYTININAHEIRALDSKLRALGQYARTSNIPAFDATRAWASALLFWDPNDDQDGSFVDTVYDLRARDIVADIAALCRWASGWQRGCEMAVPSVRDGFLRVAKVGKAVVARGRGAGALTAVAEYEARKGKVVAGVLVAVGRAGRGAA